MNFRKFFRSPSNFVLIIFFGLLAIFPFYLGSFSRYIIKLCLVAGIFAIAYDVFFGYSGMVSFGHSTFYGLSAYSMAIFSWKIGIANPLLLLGIGVVTGIVIGILCGYICTFTKGIYLALITFALAHISWLAIMTDPFGLTNGENGILIETSALKLGGLSLPLAEGKGLYFLILILFISSYISIRHLMHSPFGDILRGIRSNEERVQSLGYNTRKYKIVSFMITGALSGLAGCLAGFLELYVTPSFVVWTTGLLPLLSTILGGPGTLIGPVGAAFILTNIKNYLSGALGGSWILAYGGLFIVVVMFLRGGLATLFNEIKELVPL